jgi:hypothetical protein
MLLDWGFGEDVLENLKHNVEAKTIQGKRTNDQSDRCNADDQRQSRDTGLRRLVSIVLPPH